MKKQIILFVAIAVLMSGCFFPIRTTRVIGSGNVITESRWVGNFSAVELSGIGTMIITQGDTPALEITAEENIMKYLQSDLRGNDLVLRVQDFVSLDPRADIVYRLTVTDLERIETSGLGSIEIDSLVAPDLYLEISGSGNVHINDLQTDNFMLEVSGLGDIEVAGRAEEQRVELSGAGNYDAALLYSKNANVEISGTGTAIVWAEKMLDVEISGMGSLKYYGNPTLSTEMSGVGKIESMGEK